MTLHLKPSELLPGTVGKIRDSMQFSDEWHVSHNGDEICLRLYWTKGGTYGPQCRAILWIHGAVDYKGPWASAKTGGCGYNKEAAAVAEVLTLAGLKANDGYSGGAQLAMALGIAEGLIHHAHG